MTRIRRGRIARTAFAREGRRRRANSTGRECRCLLGGSCRRGGFWLAAANGARPLEAAFTDTLTRGGAGCLGVAHHQYPQDRQEGDRGESKVLTCVAHAPTANQLPRLPANIENYNLRSDRD